MRKKVYLGHGEIVMLGRTIISEEFASGKMKEFLVRRTKKESLLERISKLRLKGERSIKLQFKMHAKLNVTYLQVSSVRFEGSVQ